jgi:cyclic pyranopterin phosphate synthase
MDNSDLAFLVGVAALLGIRRVRLTGGEPLLKPDLPELVAALSGIAGILEVSLTTNGHLLASLAGTLKQAGLSRVNVSLDSLRAERYRYLTRGGELSDALAGLTAAMAAELTPVKINCVVVGGINDDELADFAALTYKEPLSVRFIELMRLGVAEAWPATRFVSVKAMQERLGPLENASEVGAGPANMYRLPGAVGTIGFISGDSEHFCADCNRVRVTSRGSVRPCLFSSLELDVLEAVKRRDERAVAQTLQAGISAKQPRDARLAKTRMAEIGG